MSLSDKLKGRKLFHTWKLRPQLLTSYGIPAPMYGLAPRTVLGETWWNATRRAAYLSTNYHCQACGVPKEKAKGRKWLEGHEVYDIDQLLGRMVYVETVPLCHYCHCFLHDGRLRSLLDSGKLPHQKYAAVIQHGEEILARYGLEREQPFGPAADWEDWRLVVNGKEYKPLYSSYAEYLRKRSKRN